MNRYYFSIVINISLILLILLIQKFLPPELPLLYGKPIGEEQLTGRLGLTIAPIVSLFITLTNMFISSQVTDAFLKKVLSITSLFISILSAITVVKVIFLIWNS